MCYGHWQVEGPNALLAEGEVRGAEILAVPQEDHRQGFEIIGSLSEMYSSEYIQATTEGGSVTRLHVNPVIGKLRRLIPSEGEKGKDLPFWLFVMSPSQDATEKGGET